jgi:hypothetical protein
MSVQAMSWVIENSNVRGNNYIVLLMIANRADEDGSSAWPSVRWLAKRSRLSERTVQRCLRKLQVCGALAIEPGAGPKGTNCYHVVMQASLAGGDKLTPRQHRPKGVTAVSPNTSLSVQKLNPPVVPPAGGQTKNSFSGEESLQRVGREWIAVKMGNRKRLFSENEWSSMAGIQAKYLVEKIRARGFEARVVPEEETATWPKRETA